jgi:NADH-quinone oxidoreductase subunit J
MAFDIAGTANVGLGLVAVLFVLVAIEIKDLIKSAIALGIASALLAGVFYVLGAPFAAVFELSVCAGLVTVLLLSSVSMTEEKEVEHEQQ